MDIGIVSMRYAKALLGYAKSTNTEDMMYKRFGTLCSSFATHPDLRQALGNPILSKQEKYDLICVAASGQKKVEDEFSRSIMLILANKREDMLQYIGLSFLRLYRNSRHIGVAKLTTAVPVTREVEERIKNSASSILHAQMELQVCVDPNIEGGFVFDINDYRLDASIATQFKIVKQQFIDKNRRIV